MENTDELVHTHNVGQRCINWININTHDVSKMVDCYMSIIISM